MHPGRVEPDEKRRVGLGSVGDETLRRRHDLVVDGFHALLSQRAGVFDPAVGVAVDDAARTEVLTEIWEVLGSRIVSIFGLFFGVEVIQVAEELVEAMIGREEFVAVAEVVLAELAGGVPLRLERCGNRRILVTETQVGARHAHLGQPSAIRVLPGDKRSSASGAALFAVVVGEHCAFFGDPVDVRRLIPHESI